MRPLRLVCVAAALVVAALPAASVPTGYDMTVSVTGPGDTDLGGTDLEALENAFLLGQTYDPETDTGATTSTPPSSSRPERTPRSAGRWSRGTRR